MVLQSKIIHNAYNNDSANNEIIKLELFYYENILCYIVIQEFIIDNKVIYLPALLNESYISVCKKQKISIYHINYMPF